MGSVRQISNCCNTVVPNDGTDGARRSPGETGDNSEPARGVIRDQEPAADIFFYSGTNEACVWRVLATVTDNRE